MKFYVSCLKEYQPMTEVAEWFTVSKKYWGDHINCKLYWQQQGIRAGGGSNLLCHSAVISGSDSFQLGTPSPCLTQLLVLEKSCVKQKSR